jgi:hypothetical protein
MAVRTTAIKTMQEGQGALKLALSETDNDTMKNLLSLFDVLVLHYSNCGTENKTVILGMVYFSNTQMLYVENPLFHILIKELPIKYNDCNLMGHSLYCFVNYTLITKVIHSPNCELIFMRTSIYL